MSIDVKLKLLRNGLAIEYAEHGDKTGAPVIFLHGYADSWRSFEPAMARLPRRLRAIALSQRGHGGSDKPDGRYRPQDFAADAAAFMDAMNIPSAIVVGHSMGTQIARRLASDHPARVSGLVLIGAYAGLYGNPAAEELAAAVTRFVAPVDPAFVRAFQESTLARPVSADFMEAIVGESMLVPARVWRSVLADCLQDETQLGPVTAPALLVWGEKDAIFGQADQDALLASMPNARLAVYRDAGHSPHWEEPARVAQEIVGFVDCLGEGSLARAAAEYAQSAAA